jgi:ABC-type uncharacterized transport system permease subunit
MKTPFNTEQKKRTITIAVASALAGFAIGFMISMLVNKKYINKLEAKILKLEGWQ